MKSSMRGAQVCAQRIAKSCISSSNQHPDSGWRARARRPQVGRFVVAATAAKQIGAALG